MGDIQPIPDNFTIVRTAITPALAAELHRVQQAAYAVESARIDYPGLPPLRETAADLLRRPERWLLCQEDGDLLGALAFLPSPGLLEISRLFVMPGHFRRGVASRLLRELEKFTDAGHRIIVSTAAANGPALALYEKHRYQIVSQTITDDGLGLAGLEKQLRF